MSGNANNSVQNVSVLERCAAAESAANAAIGWIRENPDKVGRDGILLQRDFRKFAVQARKLEAAVDRPMCVAVFGPSQAGKSYLISALARRGTDPLKVTVGGRELDFVKEINPEGGQESTGLVTRFTLRQVPGRPDAPVVLRLLSQTDIVKIIGNTFLSDFDLSGEQLPGPEQITELLGELSRKAGTNKHDSLSEDDVYDLQEYFELYFRGQPLVGTLGQRYWDAAADLAPRLMDAERAILFSVLWNQVEPLTNICASLLNALRRIDFADEAYCALDGLIPRETSIIDVKTLQGLGQKGNSPIAVIGKNGKEAQLERCELTALIAELTMPLTLAPWPFFEHTDVLDFPGARSRENISEPRKYLQDQGKIPGLFLRGKVAYLYQRYCAEQELTAMLLCISGSNQEVRTLPAMVKEWVDLAQGAEPAERARQQTALFLALTKFDAEFEEKRGQSESSDSRWTTRLNASLLDFFGKTSNWPHEWLPGLAFDNTFWLRNPNVKAKHILEYDEQDRETAIRGPERPRIERQKNEYLKNEFVRRHIRNAERAWDEAMRLNDGGISYLAEQIAPVCHPQIKLRQIDARSAELCRRMSRRLERFYISGDIEQELKKRMQEVRKVVFQLAHCAEQQRFGRLLREMQVDFDLLVDVNRRIENGQIGGGTVDGDGAKAPEGRAQRPVGARASAGRLLKAVFGDDPGTAVPGGPAAPARDEAELFANESVSMWLGRMRRLAEDQQRLLQLAMTGESMATLIGELSAAVGRLQLREQIADLVRTARAYRQRSSFARSAMITQNLINGFINYLGYGAGELAGRPAIALDGGGNRPIFAPRPPVTDFPVLGEESVAHEEEYYTDWCAGLVQLVQDNVRFRDNKMIDVAANVKLGGILTILSARA